MNQLDNLEEKISNYCVNYLYDIMLCYFLEYRMDGLNRDDAWKID